MKRIWFAIFFIVLCAGICVGEQVYVKNVYEHLNDEISKASEYEDFNDLVDSIKDIKEYWNAKNDLLFIISEHAILNDLSTKINSLDPKNKEIKSALAEAKALNYAFYENRKLKLSNIL